MYIYFYNMFTELKLDNVKAGILATVVMFSIIILLTFFANYLAKKVIIKFVQKLINKSKNKWDDIYYNSGIIHNFSHLAPVIVLYLFAPTFGRFENILKKIVIVYMSGVGIIIFENFLSASEKIYNTFDISKEKPIKGYIQVIKIFAIIIGVIIIIGAILDKSPWKLLSGIGAMTAIIMLVFKDSILGFVAGIQLITNDMIKIGDWVEAPAYGADGDVVEISLTTVKVQNWNKTISYIPVYALISDSFKNWKGISEAGGRRIKRPINIDMNTVKFCDEKMLNKFKKIDRLKDYINEKNIEIEKYNEKHDLSEKINGRRLTNIGSFRAYVYNYLRNHPEINQELTLLVRQLKPTEKGLPIEIYCFTKSTAWSVYEDIQADIFDHIISVAEEFNLKVFQEPTGQDFRKLLINKE